MEEHDNKEVIIHQLKATDCNSITEEEINDIDCFRANKNLKFLYVETLSDGTYKLKANLDLAKIKETITENRNKAMVVVNSAMIITYYQIGTIINQRKEWGNKFIQRLADDLKDYGKGYSYERLKKMSQFAHFFSENEIRSQPVTQIPWSTLSRVIKIKGLTHCINPI